MNGNIVVKSLILELVEDEEFVKGVELVEGAEFVEDVTISKWITSNSIVLFDTTSVLFSQLYWTFSRLKVKV
jgi:hypothetical protein